MAGVREVKSRIKSVKNIQQITKAMKMVAAARIKKVETRMKASRPYAYKMKEVVEELTLQVGAGMHPLMASRPTQRVAVVVVAADKGLCGSYNNALLKLAHGFIDRLGAPYELHVVGGKASRYFHKRNLPVVSDHVNWSPDIELARTLAQAVTDAFIAEQVDAVHCVYTRTVSAMTQQAVVERILPMASIEKKGHALPYIFEPDPATALESILPRYLEIIFFQILLEARTSELGARLRAMSNATDNANKVVSELTLEYFRARQAAITNEILEVCSGAEALKKR